MQVTVKHMIQNTTTGDVEGYRDVAVVNFPDGHNTDDILEYAYRWTNNVMGSWSIKEKYLPMRDGSMMENGDYNEDVTVLYNRPDGMGQRSTMVGDRMEVGGIVYRVAMLGFKEIGYAEELA